MYYKNCKKHTGNTYPKKLILISKNEIIENQNVLFVWLKELLFMKLKTSMIKKVN